MAWVFTPFTPVLVVSIVVSFALAAYIVTDIPDGARTAETVGVLAVLVGAGWWSTTSLLVLSSSSLDVMRIARAFETIGGTTVAVGWFVFAAGYTDRDRWLSRPVLGGLVAVLGAGVVLNLANPFHDLFVADVSRVVAGSFSVPAFEFTAAHYVWIGANYLPILAGTYAVLRRVLADRSLYRWQVVSLAVAVGVPLAANLKDTFGVGPFPNVTFSSMAFTVTGIALTVGVARYRLLDVAPVARRQVVRDMRDGYLVLDDADRIVDYNDSAAELLGLDDPIGDPLDAVVPSGWNPAAEAETEFVLDGPDPRFLEASYTPLDEEQALMLLRDVTDRRAVEKRYERLIEMASDVVLVLDADGRVTFATPSIERVLGTDPGEAEGTDVRSVVHPEDREDVDDALAAVRDSPEEVRRFECRLSPADGTTETVDVFLRNLLDDPYVEGLVVNARVVTERKERERELRRRNDRLDQFASIVSHDLRNPLNVAVSRLELLDMECESEHLDPIEDSLDRMETIIDDTLTLARQGQTVAEVEPVQVGHLVDQCWSRVETRNATLEVTDDLRVEADPQRLEQIFENLFRNAVEHGSASPASDSRGDAEDGSPDGRQEIAGGGGNQAGDPGRGVHVRVGALDGGFYVEDDGPGIPDSEREAVFEAGTTSDPDGTGFGLAIVEEVAEAHGWTVAVTDGTEGGARFEFTGVDLA